MKLLTIYDENFDSRYHTFRESSGTKSEKLTLLIDKKFLSIIDTDFSLSLVDDSSGLYACLSVYLYASPPV